MRHNELWRVELTKIGVSDCGRYYVVRLPTGLDQLFGKASGGHMLAVAKKGLEIHNVNVVTYKNARVMLQICKSTRGGWKLSDDKKSLFPMFSFASTANAKFQFLIRNEQVCFLSDKINGSLSGQFFDLMEL